MTSKKEKKKFDWRNLVLIIFSTGITLGILEIFLQLFFSTDQDILYKDYQSNRFITHNKYWKAWHYPNNETIHTRDCFRGVYTTNEFGMKDDPVAWEKIKIALLGDSYVEGHGKDNQQTISHYLQTKVGENYDILNFGSSGSIGTVHEISMYDNLVKHFNPELVILFFLNYNDLNDNLNAISEGYIDQKLNFTYPTAKSFEEIKNYIHSFGTPPKQEYEKGGLIVFKLADRGLRSLGATISSAISLRFDFRGAIAEIYAPQESKNVQKAYRILEHSLLELKKQVKSNGSKLILVQLADPFQLDPNWLAVSEKKFGLTLKPDYPNEKVKNICQMLEIPYFDMYPATKNYIKKKNMEYPYLFHECDRHYNEEGNRWAAELVYQYLKEKKIIN